MSDSTSISILLSLTSSPSSPRVPLKVPTTTTGTQLRSLVSDATSIPLSSLKLIFRGRLIPDDTTKKVLEEFKIEEGNVVHCMGKPSDGGGAATAAASSTTSVPQPASGGSSVTVPPTATPAAAASPPASGSSDDDLTPALSTLRTSNSPPAYLTAITTLEKILTNITSHPMEEKYRKVKKNNAAFQRRLGGVAGGDDAMKGAGFKVETVDGEESYVLEASADAWPKLVRNLEVVKAKVVEAKAASAATAASPPPTAAAAASGGVPGMGGWNGVGVPPPSMAGGAGGFGGGAGGSIPPGMEGAVADMMSNPEQLQSMLQNPMVQQMMQNDPRFANNPQMRSQMAALANNPDMVRQLSTMMSDPSMRAAMQQMHRSGMGSMGGSMGGGGGGTTAGSGTTGGGGAAAPGAGMNPTQMMQQMQMLQRMSQQMGAAGAPGTNPPGQQQPPAGGGQPVAGGTQQQQGSSSGGNTGGDDSEMTEEEMIAEAIARSLQEN